MNSAPSILIIARPGNDRRSLVALLRTLGRSELFLHDGRGALPMMLHPDLVMVDLDSQDRRSAEALICTARQWPTVHCLALVTDIRQAADARALGADSAMPRNASAGELLQTVVRLTRAATVFQPNLPVSSPAAV